MTLLRREGIGSMSKTEESRERKSLIQYLVNSGIELAQLRDYRKDDRGGDYHRNCDM
jgi:hypothetical protein